ncbi:MAG: hypothetical protein ACOYN3_10285, partial [Acidimicrobiia bacterium]
APVEFVPAPVAQAPAADVPTFSADSRQKAYSPILADLLEASFAAPIPESGNLFIDLTASDESSAAPSGAWPSVGSVPQSA